MDAFVRNLFRDLRDRHLLLPVLALVIALVAVPKLLGKDAEPTAPPAPAPSASSGSPEELSSAVLADNQVSVRDYRKRLKDLKSKNPFHQQFRDTPADVVGTTGATGAAGSTAPTDSGVTTGTTQTTGPSGTPGTSPGDENPSDGGGGGGTGSNGNSPSGPDVNVVNHLYTRRVDVLIGVQGLPQVRQNVLPMTTLPSKKNPVAAYLGTDEKGKRAAFVLSRDISLIGGDGACVPSPENCLFITLEKDETATLTFDGEDGQTYELKLLAIRKHEIKPKK
jgi:hypothetical protein